MISSNVYVKTKNNAYYTLDQISTKDTILNNNQFQTSVDLAGGDLIPNYHKINEITKNKETNCYKITTDKGNVIRLSESKKVSLEIYKDSTREKESYYGTPEWLYDQIKNENKEFFAKIYNVSNEKKDEKDFRPSYGYGSYNEGALLALLIHQDSNFYPANPTQTSILLKYNSDISENPVLWNRLVDIEEKPDLLFPYIINMALGYDTVANANTNETENVIIDNKEFRINKNIFKNYDNILHDSAQTMLKIYFEFDEYGPNDNIGLGANKILPKKFIDAITYGTSEEFRAGFLFTLLDLNNVNNIYKVENNIISSESEDFINLLREICASIQLDYKITTLLDGSYTIQVYKSKIIPISNDKIVSIEKIENPEEYEWVDLKTNDGFIICNGFKLLLSE